MRSTVAWLLAAAIGVGWVQMASAADLPVKAPIYKAPAYVAPPVYSWTGCYIGGQVGYAWARDKNDETVISTGADSPYSPTDSAKPDGAKLGGYLGCNWQVSSFVLGVEGDGEWADLKDSADFSNTGTPPDYYETKIDSQGSIRGRVGYAFDRVLVYATGGVAFAHVKEHDVAGSSGVFSDNSTTRTGWTIGGGVDYAFLGNWIARIEYRYADFGTYSYNPAVFSSYTENHKITENAVRVGIAYKFW